MAVIGLPVQLVYAGEKDGGGGNVETIEKALTSNRRLERIQALEIFLIGPLASQRISYLIGAIDTSKILNEKARATFQDLISKGMTRDIRNSAISLMQECSIEFNGKKVIKSAAAKMNRPGTSICVNAIAIVDSLGTELRNGTLMGLLVHEYAHHFGVLDEDHSLAIAVAEAIETEDESDELIKGESNWLLTEPLLTARRIRKDPEQAWIVKRLDDCHNYKWNCYFRVP